MHAGASGAELPAEVAAALQACGVDEPDFHAAVIPLSDAGRLSLEVRAAEPVLPASVFKIVTTAAALDRFGPAWTWRTRFYAMERPEAGGMASALWIKASGAPWLPASDFREGVARLRQLGLKRIEVPLVIDRSVFSEPPVDPAQFDGEPFRPYNQGPDALALGVQSVTCIFSPDPASGEARVTHAPELPGYAMPARAPLQEGDCPSNLARALLPQEQDSGLVFRGGYPASCGERAWSVTPWPGAWFGDRYAGEVFRGFWEAEGGIWTGRAETGAVPESARELLSIASRPLADLVKAINKNSINPMARNLFLLLSAGEGTPGTLEGSRRALSAWLASKGVDAAGFAPDNGSGLSRRERASVRQIAGVLRAAYESWWAPELLASLPIAGQDGTMRRRGLAAGSARVKTGYMRGVRSIAGYVKASSGGWYAVCAIINSPAAAGAGKALDALLAVVAREG